MNRLAVRNASEKRVIQIVDASAVRLSCSIPCLLLPLPFAPSSTSILPALPVISLHISSTTTKLIINWQISLFYYPVSVLFDNPFSNSPRATTSPTAPAPASSAALAAAAAAAAARSAPSTLRPPRRLRRAPWQRRRSSSQPSAARTRRLRACRFRPRRRPASLRSRKSRAALWPTTRPARPCCSRSSARSRTSVLTR